MKFLEILVVFFMIIWILISGTAQWIWNKVKKAITKA